MTDTHLAPFPSLPLPPDDPGEFLTFFTGDIITMPTDANGELYIKIKVHPEFKWNAMPLSDVRGRRFIWTVHTPRGRRPVLNERRQVVVADAFLRREQRKKERAWKNARDTLFVGEPDDD